MLIKKLIFFLLYIESLYYYAQKTIFGTVVDNKNTFIGNTNLSKQCKIKNPNALFFDYDTETGTLEAYSKEPLIFINKGIGYKITYDLVNFELKKNTVTYLGYSKYKQLKGNKNKLKRWKKNRLKAYKGSRIHFVRALRTNRLKKEGFIIDQFKRIPNLNRPHDTIIKKAQKYLKSLHGNLINFNIKQEIENPITKKDSAINIIRKRRLQKFFNVTIKKNVLASDLIYKEDNNIKMAFDHFLKIIYLNEKEEYNYRPFQKNRLDVQNSIIQIYSDSVILDPSGE